MNFLVAVALLLVDAEDAFWLLVGITENHLNNYYDAGLIGAQVDQLVLKELIKQKCPEIDEHLQMNDVDITSLTLNWFMAIFIDNVPFETLLRIWDCFLLEGSKVLFRFALSILMIHRETILTRTDTISMMKQIKDSTKNLIDVETLFKVLICFFFVQRNVFYSFWLQVAFEDLKPFCHRKDIAVKQAYWKKILVEKIQKRHFNRETYRKTEFSAQNSAEFLSKTFQFDETNCSTTVVDCAVVLPESESSRNR